MRSWWLYSPSSRSYYIVLSHSWSRMINLIPRLTTNYHWPWNEYRQSYVNNLNALPSASAWSLDASSCMCMLSLLSRNGQHACTCLHHCAELLSTLATTVVTQICFSFFFCAIFTCQLFILQQVKITTMNKHKYYYSLVCTIIY